MQEFLVRFTDHLEADLDRNWSALGRQVQDGDYIAIPVAGRTLRPSTEPAAEIAETLRREFAKLALRDNVGYKVEHAGAEVSETEEEATTRAVYWEAIEALQDCPEAERERWQTTADQAEISYNQRLRKLIYAEGDFVYIAGWPGTTLCLGRVVDHENGRMGWVVVDDGFPGLAVWEVDAEDIETLSSALASEETEIFNYYGSDFCRIGGRMHGYCRHSGKLAAKELAWEGATPHGYCYVWHAWSP
jgi:hypothetical protein